MEMRERERERGDEREREREGQRECVKRERERVKRGKRGKRARRTEGWDAKATKEQQKSLRFPFFCVCITKTSALDPSILF
jgi:hypothetical protein